MRWFSFSLLVVLALTSFASADLKIKTRTTVMGHSTESTVYIKGSRERSETTLGGRFSSTSIMQCDQKRIITIMGNQCSVMSLGSNESSCSSGGANTNPDAKAQQMDNEEPTAKRKGGVVTITRTSTDTGERQEMFGYKARHIKSTMTMESSPDACNQQHMKMEMDGWYADLANFSCADESYRSMACGGAEGKHGCNDHIVVKGSGGARLGYPLKQTMTMTTEHGNFTITTEVVEITNTPAEASLFDAPANCKVTNVADTTPATSTPAPSDSAPAPKPAAEQPAAAPAPTAPPKPAGTIRIGVVKIKDTTGESLPTDSLMPQLLNEIAKHQFDVLQLDADAPESAVESEARAKQCDYYVFTVPTQAKDPNSGGLSPAVKGVSLDPAKYQAATAVTLYKVGKPAPELKDVIFAADAPRFAVDAVSATFVLEGNKIAEQVAEDAHPKTPAKTSRPGTKPAAKPGTTTHKSQ